MSHQHQYAYVGNCAAHVAEPLRDLHNQCLGETLLRVLLLLVSTVAFTTIASPAFGQTEKPQSGAPSQLVEGLLDLLKEPEPSPAPEAVKAQRSSLPPEDVGLDGEDLGEKSSSPLESVRQCMLIAAGYLERGDASSETQNIQQDIVMRLDDLISQLENQSSQEQRERSEQRQQTSQQQLPRSRTQSPNQLQGDLNANPEPGSNNPGEQGEAIDVTVDMSDPRALQQSVWGQLPERVRQQMQSRMVERFLPSYREQIEAYFQALLKQQK